MFNLKSNNKFLDFFLKTFLITTVFTLFFSLVFLNSNFQTFASPRNSEITAELREINSGVEDLTKRKDSLAEEVERINQQIKRTEKIIEESQALIKSLEEDIVKNQEEIDRLTQNTKDILKEIQISGNNNPIKNILSAENLSDLLNQIYIFSTRHDQLRENRDSLEKANQEKENNVKIQQEILTESEMTRQVLVLNKSDKDSLLREYQGREEEYTARIRRLRAEQEELEKLARQAEERRQVKMQQTSQNQSANNQRSASSNPTNTTQNTTSNSTSNSNSNQNSTSSFIPNPASGGCFFEDSRDPGISGFINPVPGATVFRGNDFGCPTVSGRFHDGIDLHAPAGTPIGATASGVVANKGSGNVVGYGHWIMLRHTMSSGENVYSLYAHMQVPSSLNIGESVSQGQTIGRVGCSGLCWGDHVHFMLYSSSYERSGMGCNHGSSKCFNPARWISF